MEDVALQITSVNDIQKRHRHIFLSPHFDDVVYSCGGTLGVQVYAGLHPLVITVFGGVPEATLTLSPFAQNVHREMGLRSDPAQAVNTRRREDAMALDHLGVDYLWLDYPDAIYRGNPPYYNSRDALIGGEVHPADVWIIRELSQMLYSLHQRLPDTVWYAPLGVGRHVDHQIVSSAMDRLIQSGARVNFYEDFPYVLQQGALEARLNDIGGGLEPALVEMSEMLPQRIEAASMYTSQLEVNFGDQASLARSMESYTHGIRPVHTVHLERYWTPDNQQE
jgi:LmbE family N-acetylglucosaminyl deacetylase